MNHIPTHDLVVYGATGFVGRIITRYLIKLNGSRNDIKWAIAGRSKAKLEQLKKELGPGARNLPVIIADAQNTSALEKMCAQTRVVISTVGPYAIHGEPLIKTCVTSGTDYCDLTGEIQWIHSMIQRYEATAEKSGARIVHCCGFDSIPSDIGVFFLQQQSLARYGKFCSNVNMRVKKVKGSFSGGTIASMINTVKEGRNDARIRKVLTNPYSLCPLNGSPRPHQKSVTTAFYDDAFGSWTAPFIMAIINEHVVQRSNALLNPKYSDAFIYNEGMLTGPGSKGRRRAKGMSLSSAFFVSSLLFPPVRWLLERFILPRSGQGPSRKAQRNGFYDILFLGETEDGNLLKVKVSGDQDPGYGSTAKMLGQAGICLTMDISKQDKPGGFWTPATIFGSKLIDRLRLHAGLSFDVVE
ncbi:MAG: saccharopine dehydrogenase NADP-binding domain-containing protein [Desulfobacteraceae bacterium]|jgi:short subunit dehydrogenase-like uncharacterized protein